MAIMQIRDAQLRAMREITTLHSVEGGLVKLFPEECQAMGPRAVQELAEHSIENARAFGFEPQHYLGFASLQLVFGPEFWEHPEHEWARAVLLDEFLWTSAHKMQALREASTRYLAQVAEQEEQQEALAAHEEQEESQPR